MNKEYLHDFIKALEQYNNICKKNNFNNNDRVVLKDLVFNGIKVINFQIDSLSNILNKDEIIENFNIVNSLKDVIGLLTPKEFEEIFPINKKYCDINGFIKLLPDDEPINKNINIMDFLVEYDNQDVFNFITSSLINLTHLQKLRNLSTKTKTIIKSKDKIIRPNFNCINNL